MKEGATTVRSDHVVDSQCQTGRNEVYMKLEVGRATAGLIDED